MQGLHVYIDVDDVLAETTRALADLARRRFGRTVEFDDMADFDLAVSLGLDPGEYAQFMEEAHDERFLLDLAPMAGAVQAVSCWVDAGALISVVTGRPPQSRRATERWLGHAGFVYHRLELVDKYGRYEPTEGPHRDELTERGYAFVIEDSLEMADFFATRTDAFVMLVDRPWNRGRAGVHPRVQRVRDWGAIVTACAALAPDAAARRTEPEPPPS